MADGSINLLIVDDDASLREALKESLERATPPFYVDTAADLTVAKRLFRERTYDLLIVDIRLGKESGVDFIRTVRNANPLISIIILSGYGDRQDMLVMSKKAQIANTYLSKPIKTPDLIQWIHKVLANRNNRFPEIPMLQAMAEAKPDLELFLEQERSLTVADVYNEVRRASPFGLNFLSGTLRQAGPATLEGEETGASGGVPPRVLFVDDDKSLLESVAIFFQSMAVPLKTATDLDSAKTLWQQSLLPDAEPFDVLLVDVVLERGTSVIPFIREVREQIPGIPIVVLSGHAQQQHMTDLLQLGVVDYLEKPTRNEKIMQSVYSALETRDFVTRFLEQDLDSSKPVTVVFDDEKKTYSVRELYDQVRQGTKAGRAYREQMLASMTKNIQLDQTFDEMFLEDDE